ncbi:extensin-like domain-containing protein [Rhodospirillum rubrum]|uniref:Extensin-like n=1 Tax=Rhodospirillum rubrum (strain ATCC 11170 / ATH 1.1.1 / DSM 467 / LMG 4362 / NCIMB 8255 / S1) TaxID=269796 RepID=Q2RTT4_RHORT|nr:extensin family protein [Rhodospirillum rubrum]ABC22461.1 Extensin-like [Rhodospirillum rubrum ATCC 11170]MBK5954043.1 extensin [Rhodospirillum rubrum]QXG82093.1 extensin family protein [Rhodospirillum rubrum]HCF18054.1 extensin [Rhodospirillum rubrum]
MRAGYAVLLGVLALIGTVVPLHQSWIRLPPNILPWAPITLDAPPGPLARFHINALTTDGPACLNALDRSDLSYRRLAERPLNAGCGLETGVRPLRSQVTYNGSFQATCALMAAQYWYEGVLRTLALRHFASPLVRIDHLGTYACRNINSRPEGRRSQHATANAIDIAAFHLENGESIVIRRDWGKPTAKGLFLAEARDAACGLFNAVLGPAYNAAHADHFHLDLGRFRVCR